MRDSVGIRIVENRGTTDARSGWRLSEPPIFRTGWEPDDPPFEFVSSGMLREDGQVVVADSNGSTIYVLSADGRPLWRLGRPGQGPGEFLGPIWAMPGGADSIFVQEMISGELSLFVGEEHVWDRRMPWGRPGLGAIPQLSARAPHGGLVLVPGGYNPRGDDNEWGRSPVVTTDADLARVDTLVLVDHFQRRPQSDRNPIRYFGFVDASVDRIIHGRSDGAELTWYDLSGGVVQIVRWDAPAREPDDGWWLRYEAARRASGFELRPDLSLDQLLADERAALRGPLPVFSRLVADSEGNAWLGGDAFPAQPPTRYDIISRDGSWLGAIDMPERTYPLHITADLFLGVERDELDLQAVVLYEIVKPTASR